MGAIEKICLGKPDGSRIPEALFGMNLEITRNTFFGGLSAQCVNNRKFFTVPGEPFPRGWMPRENCSVAECAGRLLPLLRLSRTPTGLTQAGSSACLRPKIPYHWRLRLRGRFRAHLILCIGAAKAEICACGNGPESAVTLRGQIFSPEGETGEFQITAVGEGEIFLESASLLPADSVAGGLRPDVISHLRALRPSALRFPGGCFAEFSDWKQGLLPADERPVVYVEGMDFLLGPTWNQDPQDMNLDDFMEVCHMVGAQPHYTVRMTGSTPENAAELVEYANGAPETRWGRVRAERGHPDPYNIRRFYIGNEIYPFVPGMKDPDRAAEATVAFARAIKNADSSVELVPSCWALSDWNARFLARIQQLGGTELFSLASYHQYLLDLLEDHGDVLVTDDVHEPSHASRMEECLRAPVQSILPRMQGVRRELEAAGEAFGALPVTLDEWNFYWGRKGHPLLALYMLGMFHVLIRQGQNLGIREAMYFHPINEGILRVEQTAVLWEDGAHAWTLARAHAGRHPVPLESCPQDGICDAAASADGNSLYVTLVNRSMTSPCTVEIPILRFAFRAQAQCWHAEDPIADALTPGSLRACSLLIADGRFTLPPASMASLWIEKTGAAPI